MLGQLSEMAINDAEACADSADALPFMEGLLSHAVLLRLSILVEVGPQSLWILLVCCREAQLEDSLVETH